MASNPTPNLPLSFYDYCSLGRTGTQTLFSAAGAFFEAPFRGKAGAPTLKRHVAYNAIRTLTRNTSVRQMQMLSTPTTEVYKAFVKVNKLPLRQYQLEDGTTCCWLGPEKSTKVMLFFHGGGYTLSATAGHFQLLLDSLRMSNHEKSSSLSICFLAYNLAPSSPYPSQLRSGVYAYKHITETLEVSPSQVLLVGDSAGGNLALGLLSHMAHPHPDLPPVTNPNAIASTYLLSPWVTFAQTSSSMQTNRYKDCLDRDALKIWAQGFAGDAKMDNYNAPLLAPSEWWQNLKTQNITITAGADEIFVDDIEELTKRMQVQTNEIDFVRYTDEAHDGPVINLASGLPPGISTEDFHDWVVSSCQEAK